MLVENERLEDYVIVVKGLDKKCPTDTLVTINPDSSFGESGRSRFPGKVGRIYGHKHFGTFGYYVDWGPDGRDVFYKPESLATIKKREYSFEDLSKEDQKAFLAKIIDLIRSTPGFEHELFGLVSRYTVKATDHEGETKEKEENT